MIVVVKVGSSSITDPDGHIAEGAMAKLATEVADARACGHQVVLVSSGAIAAGLPLLGFIGRRPADMATLQAVAAVGQTRLMEFWGAQFSAHGLTAGQI